MPLTSEKGSPMNHVDQAEMVALTNEAKNLSEAEKTMYGISYGEAFDRDMTTVEVAAEVRKTLRGLSKSRHSLLSGSKISVRSRSFAGGTAIDVEVGLPFDTTPEEGAIGRNGFPSVFNDQALAARAAAQQTLDAYNYDGSDIQTDYFNVNFYGHANIYELEGSNA